MEVLEDRRQRLLQSSTPNDLGVGCKLRVRRHHWHPRGVRLGVPCEVVDVGTFTAVVALFKVELTGEKTL